MIVKLINNNVWLWFIKKINWKLEINMCWSSGVIMQVAMEAISIVKTSDPQQVHVIYIQ